MSLRSRMALLGETHTTSQDATNHPPLPPLVRPRRCSDGSTSGHSGHRGHRSFFQGDGHGAGANRRASDPVRTVHVRDPSALPTMQRFSSLNAVHSLPPLSVTQADPRYNAGPNHLRPQHLHARSEGNLHRGLHSPCQPRIEEQAALEDLAMEDDVVNLDAPDVLQGYEDMLPDDLVQYIQAQEQSALYGPSQGNSNEGMTPPAQHMIGQEEVAMSNDELPIQWNEVTSGSADLSPSRPQQQQQQQQQQQRSQPPYNGIWWGRTGMVSRRPFGQFGNMVVQQQQQQHPDFSANEAFGQGSTHSGVDAALSTNATSGNRVPSSLSSSVRFPQLPMSHATSGVKLESSSSNSCLERGSGKTTGTHQGFGRVPDFSQITLGPIRQSCGQQQQQQQQKQQQQENLHPSQRIGNNLALHRPSQDTLTHGPLLWPHPPPSAVQTNSSIYRNSARPQHHPQQPFSTNGSLASSLQQQQQQQGISRSGSLPHCPLAGHISGLKIEAQGPTASSCSVQSQQRQPQAQAQVQRQAKLCQPSYGDCAQVLVRVSESKPLAPLVHKEESCLLEEPPISVPNPALSMPEGSVPPPGLLLLSPGADQVTSTVEDSPGCELLDNVGLEFTPILEDGYDQVSLASDSLSVAGVFQGVAPSLSSRASSRLTTARGAAPFASVPSGVNNMAIGDMSSLLSTLAQESQFLAIMQ